MENGVDHQDLQRENFRIEDHQPTIGDLVNERFELADLLEVKTAALRSIDEKLREAGIRLPGMARVRKAKAAAPKRTRKAKTEDTHGA